MKDWLLNDLLQQIAPRVVAALIALAAAHSSVLTSWGINVNWSTLQGKLVQAAAVLIGIALAHHGMKAVKPPETGAKS